MKHDHIFYRQERWYRKNMLGRFLWWRTMRPDMNRKYMMLLCACGETKEVIIEDQNVVQDEQVNMHINMLVK